ncbi:hypothetical protein A6770_09150 [Nostoc minutum NIES-26]|uniref:Uncharacterized protein n=1 Tax=Nostoc minutum NIES-26 TaxID=1844469 RepID=A0A367RZU6_9NOSO|nr:hypothetical protein A6770_09150 [Nostoc minutum NIES-26]
MEAEVLCCPFEGDEGDKEAVRDKGDKVDKGEFMFLSPPAPPASPAPISSQLGVLSVNLNPNHK